ncbi:MAG: glycoside hydrolase family 16 protein [Verrucomicrobiales bacterium]|nr:glycoside hydrolase family 16 protein [Verrucomicrobiales bacterium]
MHKQIAKLLIGAAWLAGVSTVLAQRGPQLLLDLNNLEQRVKCSSEQVTVARDGEAFVITIDPGAEGYPGLDVTPPDELWNFGDYGHIEAKVTNLGDKAAALSMRVDDDGDWRSSPWNTESISLKPGESKELKVIFGYAYSFQPSHKLASDRIKRVKLFTGKVPASGQFVFKVEGLQVSGAAGEKPPVKEADIRTVPKDGWLLGNGIVVDAEKNLQNTGNSNGSTDGSTVKVVLPAGKPAAAVLYKPEKGRWSLVDYFQVRAKVRNDGKTAVKPQMRVAANASTAWAAAAQPLAPGESCELVVPFAMDYLWQGNADTRKAEKQYEFGSHEVKGVVFGTVEGEDERVLTVTEVRAEAPVAVLPEWLGQRPPVTDGEWVQTLNENFDGTSFDENLWRVYGSNYWGDSKRTGFSKSQTFVKDGMAYLRYEKKDIYHNDDEEKGVKKTYATGFLESYGKWTQRYGYFEARLKPPVASGLWPAFWLMPDRGVRFAPEQWKRADTGNGGMEFDIYEPLTAWGPHRYNLAWHWDGYGKGHKAIGTSCAYAQTDKDGFLTVGLLWTPGLAVYYCNGKELARLEGERVSSVTSDLMFTLPGGGWAQRLISDDAIREGDTDFIIDYVRVWQRKDLASADDGYWNPDGTPRK